LTRKAFFGGVIIGGSFALQKWLGSNLERIFHLKANDFASENAAPEGMWIPAFRFLCACCSPQT